MSSARHSPEKAAAAAWARLPRTAGGCDSAPRSPCRYGHKPGQIHPSPHSDTEITASVCCTAWQETPLPTRPAGGGVCCGKKIQLAANPGPARMPDSARRQVNLGHGLADAINPVAGFQLAGDMANPRTAGGCESELPRHALSGGKLLCPALPGRGGLGMGPFSDTAILKGQPFGVELSAPRHPDRSRYRQARRGYR